MIDPHSGASLPDDHRAGYVAIVGKPNVGKSTLMNQLVGERLSIITSKAQTTRHRILGILNGPDFQLVYSDTPGIIQPKYELHQRMMSFVHSSLEDADVVLFVTDIYEEHDEEPVVQRLRRLALDNRPVLLLVNKVDQATQEEVAGKLDYWKEKFPEATEVIPMSALEGFGVEYVFSEIKRRLPVHPPFYPKDELTDKPERFFAAEMVREQIFLNYKKEIPYSCEVVVDEFKEDDVIIRMRATILVERDSQKGIVIGDGGRMLKRVGIGARKALETFFAKQVFLETHVKVDADWRSNAQRLKRFGYDLIE